MGWTPLHYFSGGGGGSNPLTPPPPPPPRSASNILRFDVSIHSGIISSYRHWVKCPCPSTTVWVTYANLWHSGDPSMYLHLPYFLLHRKTTESLTLYKTMGHTFSYLKKNPPWMLTFICTYSWWGCQRWKFLTFDGVPLTCKFVIIEGQGRFTNCVLSRVVPPVVWLGYERARMKDLQSVDYSQSSSIFTEAFLYTNHIL